MARLALKARLAAVVNGEIRMIDVEIGETQARRLASGRTTAAMAAPFRCAQDSSAADANEEGAIAVTELAGAIDRSVLEVSFAAFNLGQVPQMDIVGSDFTIAQRVAVPDVGTDKVVPRQPTNVVSAAAPVFGTQMTHRLPGLRSSRAIRFAFWMSPAAERAIASDGLLLGYREAFSLLALR